MVIQRIKLVLNDLDTTASKSLVEIKTVLAVQPILNTALLTYGLSMLLVTLNFSKDRCGPVKQIVSVLPIALLTAALQLHTQSFTTRGEESAALESGVASPGNRKIYSEIVKCFKLYKNFPSNLF